MKKFLLYSFFLILSVYLLVNTIRVLIHLYEVERKTATSNSQLTALEKENEQLKGRLDEVKSDYFLEKEARDKLLLKKPNEAVYVVNQPESSQKEAKDNTKLPNWKKWYELIFG